MSASIDVGQLRESGWARISGAVPMALCNRLVEVLESELGVPVNDPSRWDAYGGKMRDLVPIWGHQAQWDIRQHPILHRIWAELWGTEHLCVSLDSCRFTPPCEPGHAEPYGIHWDHNPWDELRRAFQGVLALTDTAINQGGFRCVPSLYRDRNAWPRKPIIDADGEESCYDVRDTDDESIMPCVVAAAVRRNVFYRRYFMYNSKESFRRAQPESAHQETAAYRQARRNRRSASPSS